MSLRINTEWTTRKKAEHKKLLQRVIEQDNKTAPKPLYPNLYPYNPSHRINVIEEQRKERFIWKIGIVIISVVVVLFSTIIYLVAMS